MLHKRQGRYSGAETPQRRAGGTWRSTDVWDPCGRQRLPASVPASPPFCKRAGRPGGGSNERPLCEQGVSDSAEPPCGKQPMNSHTACLNTSSLELLAFERRLVTGRHKRHSLSAKRRNEPLFLVLQWRDDRGQAVSHET